MDDALRVRVADCLAGVDHVTQEAQPIVERGTARQVAQQIVVAAGPSVICRLPR